MYPSFWLVLSVKKIGLKKKIGTESTRGGYPITAQEGYMKLGFENDQNK